MRVLVVEDDPALRLLWKEVFSEAGHQCTEVGEASEARKHLLNMSYDLLILDLHLGNDSGLSVAALATYSNPDCKVIVTTGSKLFPRGELFTLAPAISTVMRKPVDTRELLAVSEHCISRASDVESMMSPGRGLLA